MALLVLFGMGVAAWALSTLAAGGGAILFVVVARGVLPAEQIPAVIAVAASISSVQRVGLYRRELEPAIVLANLPGLVAGSLLGAWVLRGIDPRILSAVVGSFLVALALQHFSGRSVNVGRPRPVHFTIASFVTASIGAIVGASGPLMNPFYLASGVVKERMIGTKAASSLLMLVTRLASFVALGLMSPEVWLAGAAVGGGALLGNLLGRGALRRTSPGRFTRFVYVALLVSGATLLLRTLRPS